MHLMFIPSVWGKKVKTLAFKQITLASANCLKLSRLNQY